MLSKNEVGKIGEKLACDFLIKNGYIILERNFRTRHGEIDIIAKDSDFMAFVEVKTRRSIKFGYPREAVDYYKQTKIKNIALVYLSRKKFKNLNLRFDVVDVILDNEDKTKSITIIKNAF